MRNNSGVVETIMLVAIAGMAVFGHIQYKAGLWGANGSERIEKVDHWYDADILKP